MSRASAGATVGTRRDRASSVVFVALVVLFGLLFAYDLFEAVTNLVSVPGQARYANNDFYAENGLDGLVASPPWFALIANVALPPAAFVAALVVVRRRPLPVVALVLLAGLAAVAALSLTITAYVQSV
ncbi:hypothetical protein SOM11_00140 [Frigoribacterium sp. CFBP9039]|uniref:hypothetical protein n=1 Tax=unclassified Frigoribacterium TaxID=2627005 RepID=UPI00178305A6|nr:MULTISPECIES: hypothetical protein [unclassified Frigoribacterium]MBD8702410.1 hypothetical protein [Frigoribacterium sp. CFBP 13712]MDY0944395.1 hypothetical protein [Frigoribacterium sp. CFBP9039]